MAGAPGPAGRRPQRAPRRPERWAARRPALTLEVSLQRAHLEVGDSRRGNITLRSDPVKLVLAPRSSAPSWRVTSVGPDPNRLQIDFLPSADLQGLRSVLIAEGTLLAMFMNNRAAKALGRSERSQAQAWALAALRRDPAFRPALNTLGLVYRRAGQLAAAAQAIEALLAQGERPLVTMACNIKRLPVLRAA